jgi:hypothetical protein
VYTYGLFNYSNNNSNYTTRKAGVIKEKPARNGTASADNFSVTDRFFFIQVPNVVIHDSVKIFPPQRQVYVMRTFRLRQI